MNKLLLKKQKTILWKLCVSGYLLGRQPNISTAVQTQFVGAPFRGRKKLRRVEFASNYFSSMRTRASVANDDTSSMTWTPSSFRSEGNAALRRNYSTRKETLAVRVVTAATSFGVFDR